MFYICDLNKQTTVFKINQIKMSTQALQLTQSALNSVAKPKDILELPAVADNWIRTYEKTSGRVDGTMRYEAEKVLFMQTIGNNRALDKCDKFSLYAAWIELSISGLTLRDGITYIIPYGKKAQFMVGWRGRLEQINELPEVTFCHEPVVVFDCDYFEYERGHRTRIKSHKPGQKRTRTKASIPTHVYFVIDFIHGPEVYIMDALDVLNIRDNYSASYKSYVADCKTAGKEIGDTFKIEKNGINGPYSVDVEIPMWVSDEVQAFKKTIVKRVWGTLPKLPKQKWLDEQMTERAKQMGNIDIDADEAASAVQKSKQPNEPEPDFNAFASVVQDEEPITPSEDVTGQDEQENEVPAQNNAGAPVSETKTPPAGQKPGDGIAPSTEFDKPEETKTPEAAANKLGINLDEAY